MHSKLEILRENVIALMFDERYCAFHSPDNEATAPNTVFNIISKILPLSIHIAKTQTECICIYIAIVKAVS